MSLPREIREELLSAYLDDALRGDERKRVEQLLASDEDTRALLEQMRSIQSSTKAAMQTNRRPPEGLSQQVIALAMARAVQMELPSQHHVRLAASRTDKSTAARPRNFKRTYGSVAVSLALAASLLLAVNFWNPFTDQDGFGGGANLQNGIANAETPADTTDDPSRDIVVDPVGELEDETEPRSEVDSVVDADPAATAVPLEESPSPEALATAESGRSPMEADEPAVDDGAGARTAAAALDQAIDDPAAMLATQAVMMFSVEQTEAGRANNAVLQAMRSQGIQADLKQRVDDAVVGYLQKARLVAGLDDASSDPTSSSQVSVVYVEASGKQLDQFMLSLFRDTEHIAQIGWNLAMDAPVVDATTQIEKILATDVRHAEDTSKAWQLVTGDAQQGFAAPGTGREFFAIDRANPAGWEAVGSANPGPDIRSRLLILIR